MAPENGLDQCWWRGDSNASMRPGLDGPGKHCTCVGVPATATASMRPGLDGPGKPFGQMKTLPITRCFNEAGAGWPRKTIDVINLTFSQKSLQ